MKRQILVTVHYLVEDEEGDFWDGKTGAPTGQVSESLAAQFPEKVALSEKLDARRYSLWHEPIDYLNANVMQCPICKRLITDTTKPRPILRLDAARELEGVKMCSSCAWEMGFDIQNGRSMQSILDEYETDEEPKKR